MTDEGKIGWDDKSITSSRSPMFKLESNQTARIGVLSTQATMIYDHYSQKVRRHGRCIRGEGMCPGCEKLGEPKERFAVKVLVYETNKVGELSKPVRMQVMVWVFSADKFVDLRNIKKQWGDLTQRDLMVTCPEGGGQYQKMNFVPAPKCLWRSKEEVIKKVREMAKNLKVDLESILGKKLPADELSKRLGLETEVSAYQEADLSELETEVKVEESDVAVVDDGESLDDIDTALDDLEM